MYIAWCAILGAVVGSFANVVVGRLPKGQSVVRPPSHCPHCKHRLSPLELVPILSWLALRGRCKNCGQAISVRYPLIELLFAVVFAVFAWRWPVTETVLAGLVPLTFLAVLLMAALIDLDTYTLPDVLVIPTTVLAIGAAALPLPGGVLPTLTEALAGAAAGAGVIVLINRIGGLVLRRFADTAERLWPISLDQVNFATLFASFGGLWLGIGTGLLTAVFNMVTGRVWRLHEAAVYGLWLVALVVSAYGFSIPLADAFAGSVLAAGTIAFLGGTYWWLHDSLVSEASETISVLEEEADEEPVAMGFGDVKFGAALGAIAGWQLFVIGLLFAIMLGAVAGIIMRLAGGSRFIPFGPFMWLGVALALLFGHDVLAWYLGLFGL